MPVSPNHDNFKEVVFERALKQCNLKESDRVKIRKTSNKGTIISVITNLNEVSWKQNKPMFLVLSTDDGQLILAHHSQLKRIMK